MSHPPLLWYELSGFPLTLSDQVESKYFTISLYGSILKHHPYCFYIFLKRWLLPCGRCYVLFLLLPPLCVQPLSTPGLPIMELQTEFWNWPIKTKCFVKHGILQNCYLTEIIFWGEIFCREHPLIPATVCVQLQTLKTKTTTTVVHILLCRLAIRHQHKKTKLHRCKTRT